MEPVETPGSPMRPRGRLRTTRSRYETLALKQRSPRNGARLPQRDPTHVLHRTVLSCVRTSGARVIKLPEYLAA